MDALNFVQKDFFKMKHLVSLFTGLILCSSPYSEAQEFREFYNGIRGLGMGGADIATVNDETALLVNPAALGKLRDSYGTIFDPEAEGSSGNANILLNKFFANPFSLSDVKDATDISRETPYHTRIGLFPSMVVRNFGIGIYARYTLDAEMNAAGNVLETFYQEDIATVLGYSLRLWDGRIKLGVSARAISRIQVDKDLDPTGSLSVKDHATEGLGVATDAGLILTAPWTYLPTLSIVARDIGGTSFDSGKGIRMDTADRPPDVPTDYDVALALFPIHGNNSRSSFSLQYSHVLASADFSDRYRFYHMGYEWNYADFFFLRAGMNGRYWTAGLEIASETTQLQLVSYGEEIGVDPAKREDRRYGFKFAIRY
jgi:hypothetical protein